MSYYIFQLEFDSPVHFGASDHGGGLEQITLKYTSDTLFSAICVELAMQGEFELLNQLYEMADTGSLKLSDLFPYQQEDGDLKLYLPKPFTDREASFLPLKDMEEAKAISAQRKEIKKQSYIRISEIEALLSAMKSGKPYISGDVLNEGLDTVAHKVNCRTGGDTLPYYISLHSFPAGTGLYLIAELPDDFADMFMKILESLGYSGIGGKRSAGYGKFHLSDDRFEVDDIFADTAFLQKMLEDNAAKEYMAISSVLPKENEITAVSCGRYQLMKSGGFTGGIKRDGVYMIAAGSCLKQRIIGDIINIAHDDDAFGHPVWRYGKGMFVGLPS